MAWKQPQLTDPPMGPTDEIRNLQHRLLFAYPTNSKAKQFGVVESGIFDSPTDKALRAIQTFLVTNKTNTALGHPLVLKPEEYGVLTYDTKVALGVIVVVSPAPTISIVHFSIGGAGSAWNMGYPYDIGELLDKSKCFHQPIGFNTAPVPMSKGVADGVNELVRQLNMPRGPRGENCTVLPWCATAYSMGAIVFMTVLMRVLYGDLQQFKATYMGSSAFGNPMREHGHTFPGCSYSDGEGIVTPNAHGTPFEHWDFAADKAMRGSPGDDLYSKINKAGTTADQNADMRAVWDIVNTGNPLNLAKQILNLVTSPTFHEGAGAFKAAMAALDFFVAKGVTPHTSYGTTYPIAGDPRDCWRIALDHMNDIVARTQVRQ